MAIGGRWNRRVAIMFTRELMIKRRGRKSISKRRQRNDSRSYHQSNRRRPSEEFCFLTV